MYVCQCRGITDHEIRDAVAGGARTIAEAVGPPRARRDCGNCQALLESLLRDAAGELVGTGATARS